MTEQEIVALTLVGAAAVFLVRKFSGGHPSQSSSSPPVVASSRLQGALHKVEKRKRDRG